MNREIADFYCNAGKPKIGDVLGADFAWLESCHTWCQRAFPTYEPSTIVPNSPVLDDETLQWIKRYNKEHVYALVFKYLNHYSEVCMYHPSLVFHNNRRVTRLLKFLHMLECKEASQHVYSHCKRMLTYLLDRDIVSPLAHRDTLARWKHAANTGRNYEGHSDLRNLMAGAELMSAQVNDEV